MRRSQQGSFKGKGTRWRTGLRRKSSRWFRSCCVSPLAQVSQNDWKNLLAKNALNECIGLLVVALRPLEVLRRRGESNRVADKKVETHVDQRSGDEKIRDAGKERSVSAKNVRHSQRTSKR